MKCPNLNCGLINPPDAIRCDCGFNFKKGKWEPPINTQPDRNPKYSQPNRQIKPFYKTFWFYVIVIPLFLYVIGKYPLENNKPSKNTSNKSTATQTRDKRKTVSTSQTSRNLNGHGQEATKSFYLKKGLARFKMIHSGSENFIVRLLDDEGNNIKTLTNSIGNFDGSKAVRIPKSGYYLLDINADGSWLITIS